MPAVRAAALDAKELARFDVSYVKCESRYPDMRGHRDEAYLNLWRIKSDEKSRARLAAARKSASYLSERRRILRAGAPAASSPLDQQCQALWAESQRATKAK
ncbi:MAG TPA: hypothetical protein VJ598_00740 [Albitalea sp.]|nr:hypothetical protein [Albitalea sp.]